MDATLFDRIIPGAGHQPRIFNFKFGCLHNNITLRIESGPPGPACDLVKFTCTQVAIALAIKFSQPGHDNGANRNVNAHPEGIRTGDDRQ